MTTINKNEKVKTKDKKMDNYINNCVKTIIKKDDVDTLLSMIENGFDINTFTYGNLKGINAFILYRYECTKECVGKVIDSLLFKYNAIKDVTEDSYNMLNELSFNNFQKSFGEEFSLENLICDFGKFLEDLSVKAEEFVESIDKSDENIQNQNLDKNDNKKDINHSNSKMLEKDVQDKKDVNVEEL